MVKEETSFIICASIYNQTCAYRYGRTNMHVVPECWYNLQSVAMGLQPQSALKSTLSMTISYIREAGLLQKWINQELDSVGRYVFC